MGKNIIFCADGTWNGTDTDEDQDGIPERTNVLKIFHNLSGRAAMRSTCKADEQENVYYDENNTLLQIAKYIHGVGDSRNPIIKLLSGVVGAGIIKRIVRGYTFISRNYSPGDQIYLVGFSRGAYTVRALAGLISSVGLLDRTQTDLTDQENGYRLGIQAWKCYRRDSGKDPDKLGDFSNDAINIPKNSLVKPVHIRAIAVWDTVGAIGLPLFTTDFERLDVFKFADLDLSANVQLGFHAISIDERRADFTPTLWNPNPRVEQVLFSGAHSDVGGGYPDTESGLSDCALIWLSKQLQKEGLLFSSNPVYEPKPNVMQKAHNPWQGITDFISSTRKFYPTLSIHRSVLERISDANLNYLPENIQNYYDQNTRSFYDQHVRIVEW